MKQSGAVVLVAEEAGALSCLRRPAVMYSARLAQNHDWQLACANFLCVSGCPRTACSALRPCELLRMMSHGGLLH
jgi:hypothetical protein